MPLDAWILLIVSVGLGLVLELVYVRAQRARGYDGPAGGEQADGGGSTTPHGGGAATPHGGGPTTSDGGSSE